MWGQDRFFTNFGDSLRIIPMRVGTRIYANENVMTCEDHPHACGDKKMTKKEDWEAKDHPHACGDKLSIRHMRMAKKGSSPCVWGQVILISSFTSRFRIIPMRVGTRKHTLTLVNGNKDHPHACGDKKNIVTSERIFGGSSPCVWGQD